MTHCLTSANYFGHHALASAHQRSGLEARRKGGQAASNAAIFTSVNNATQFGRRCGRAQALPVPFPGLPTCITVLPRLEAREVGLTKPKRNLAMPTRARKPSVKLVHGQAITTSLKVAEAFGKRHDHVLRAIANLECSEEFRALNFGASQYKVKTPTGGTKPLPMYTITRDGFAFLASGFTGKEAAQWKERYIAAFNELERRALDKAAACRLPNPSPGKAEAALPGGRYHYPRALLDQPHFVWPKSGEAVLSLMMLADTTHFTSLLFALLNQLRSEGHEVSAPLAEATALREAVRHADKVLNDIHLCAIRARARRQA